MSSASETSVIGRLRQIWLRSARTGSVLPSEDVLTRELGASKPTVREAMIRLEAEGLVRRAQGAGTFPNPAALDVTARLDRRVDYGQQLASAGFTPEMEVISAELVYIDPARARLLAAAEGAPGFETVRRWKGDGVPAMVARDLVPLRRRRPRSAAADPPVSPADAQQSVLTMSEQLGPGPVEWISTWPGAVNADARTAQLLDVDEGQALLTLEHIGVGRHGSRCFHAYEYHSAGFVRYGLTLDAQARG